ncbi:MAG: cellulase [Verrucomicrobiia bacterium]
MEKSVKFRGAVGLIVLGLTCPALAQSMNPQPPPSEPYLWRNVVIGGGGFVTGIVPHPRQKGLLYARTDVGGAYRWDASAQRWIPLTDWIGMADVDLTGCESIAVDPNDPQRVYLAVGTYSRGNAAILRSEDQGRTFQRTDVTFKMGGNEAGRFNGERLAVDPNDGKILFFGSRRDGLWKSSDRAATWQKVENFPAAGAREASLTDDADSRPWFGFNQQPVGIVCVLFDPSGSQPGLPTPALYAAVSTTETNLYCSTNAGATWRAVANQPVGLRPNHLVRSPDGMFYLSYGREPGPNTMTDGAVWKFNPIAGVWTDITPVKPQNSNQTFGYGCIAVDTLHPSTLMVTTFAHWQPHDEIFRSTNGGASWEPLWDDHARWDHSSAPYTRTRSPHWMGTIVINPFDSGQVLFTTGYGIWSCTNVTVADAGQSTGWMFLDAGLEETVPLALISPATGAHLLSGVGDIDGFRHDDLSQSPVEGTYSGQRYGNTEDLALAGSKPDLIVRTGTGGGRGTNRTVHASISEDGGETWNMLGSDPPSSGGAGTIAISTDGKIIVWTPRRSAPYWSADRGANWNACTGLSDGIRVVADPVNPAQFYACDMRAGRILISTNGAVSFAATPATFPAVESFGGGFGGAGVMLSATPGTTGDLWLEFRSNGLYHSTDAGTTFTKLASVQEADSLGFGKTAPGRKYPALYLAGKVGNLQALFRSDDAGESWVRINDNQHQYGWINHITGDPRIFGRVYFATGGRGIIYGDRASDPGLHSDAAGWH